MVTKTGTSYQNSQVNDSSGVSSMINFMIVVLENLV